MIPDKEHTGQWTDILSGKQADRKIDRYSTKEQDNGQTDRQTDMYSTRQRTRQWADRQTDRQTDILLDKEQDSGHADIQTDLPARWTDAVKAAQGVDTGSRRFARAPLTLVRVCVA